PADAERLAGDFRRFLAEVAPDQESRTQKDIAAWLSAHQAIQAELVSIAGDAFKPEGRCEHGDQAVFESAVGEARRVAEALGIAIREERRQPYAGYEHLGLERVELVGELDRSRVPEFRIADVQTKRTKTKPSAPFTTATLQQAAS